MRTRASSARRGIAALAGVAALLASALAASPPARACGHCVEDKVAATYDYGVVTRARAQGHRVYVFEVRGGVRADDAAARRAIASAVERAPGVDPGTVRVALDPPAVSCACAPAGRPEARVPAAARPTLAARGLALRYVTSVDR